MSKNLKSKIAKISNIKINEQTKLNSYFNHSQSSQDKAEMKSKVDEINEQFPKDKEVKIYSWNVAGLRSFIKKPYFKEFLNKENPDILCFNETKITNDIVNKENFMDLLGKDYLSYFNCSNTKKGYSGVAVYTKYKPISIKNGIGIDKHDEEGRVITLEFENFYLISTYIPNAGEGLKRLEYRIEEWDKDFQSFVVDLKNKKHILWIGDINVCHKEIDIANPKGNLRSAGFTIEERNSFDSFLNKGFVDSWRIRNENVKKYSYWSFFGNARSKNVGWRLDYGIVNEEGNKYIVESEILNEYFGSDHCPIKIILDFSK